jgi:hypothetical protein
MLHLLSQLKLRPTTLTKTAGALMLHANAWQWCSNMHKHYHHHLWVAFQVVEGACGAQHVHVHEHVHEHLCGIFKIHTMDARIVLASERSMHVRFPLYANPALEKYASGRQITPTSFPYQAPMICVTHTLYKLQI